MQGSPTAARRRPEIAAVRAQGLTIRMVAERLGLSIGQVQQALQTAPRSAAHAVAAARFPGWPRTLAITLNERYPDAAALAAASDEELLRLRDLGPWRLRQLRKRASAS